MRTIFLVINPLIYQLTAPIYISRWGAIQYNLFRFQSPVIDHLLAVSKSMGNNDDIGALECR